MKQDSEFLCFSVCVYFIIIISVTSCSLPNDESKLLNKIQEKWIPTLFQPRHEILITKTSLQAPYILALKDETTTELWSYQNDLSNWIMIYQFKLDSIQLEKNDLPDTELETLEHYLNIGEITHEWVVKSSITHLSLSPNKNKLIVVEQHRYVFDNNHFISVGIRKITLVDLLTFEKQTLLQSPLEWGISWFDNIIWSPDENQIAFQHSYRQNDFLMVIDIAQKQIYQLYEEYDIHGPWSWTPNSKVVVSSFRKDRSESMSGDTIQLCVLENKQCQDIQLDRLWIELGLDLSVDGEKVAFSAINTHRSIAIEDSPMLYVVDLESQLLEQLSTDLLQFPHWSPNGQYIAVEKRTVSNSQAETVIVVNTNTKEIIYELPIREKRFRDKWKWGNNCEIWELQADYLDLIQHSLCNNSTHKINLPQSLKGAQLGFSAIN